tara:strand:- start:5800 stop:6306 length:507 start_codon:yes stop_codon:yes gene_type:complete
MAVITPTISIRSNTSTATTNPGPLSVALSLSGSDVLTVDTATSAIITPPNSGAPLKFLDGDALQGGDAVDAPGTYGSYVYMKNTTATGANLIYIGFGAGALQGGAAPANMGGGNGTTALDASDDSSFRFMTLKPGEFAFFPWDYLQDFYCGASAASQTLEYWIFDKAQ